MEQWKQIEGHEAYEISNTGFVRVKLPKGEYKELVRSDSGCFRYYMVSLVVGPKVIKKKYIHRMVGEAFLPNPNPDLYDCIGLKNKDGHDCRLENLYWTNQKELMALRKEENKYAKGSEHHMSKMTEEDVVYARSLYQTGKMTLTQIARKFGIDPSTTGSMVKGVTWKHVK
jgi:hypothetical protein